MPTLSLDLRVDSQFDPDHLEDMLASMVDVYRTFGFAVETASRDPDLDLGTPAAGSCNLDNPVLTQGQTELFRNFTGEMQGDIVVFFVKAFVNPLGGCSVHPSSLPGAIVSNQSSNWALAHEVGHVLGLGHKNNFQNLMLEDTNHIVGTPQLNSCQVTQMKEGLRAIQMSRERSRGMERFTEDLQGVIPWAGSVSLQQETPFALRKKRSAKNDQDVEMVARDATREVLLLISQLEHIISDVRMERDTQVRAVYKAVSLACVAQGVKAVIAEGSLTVLEIALQRSARKSVRQAAATEAWRLAPFLGGEPAFRLLAALIACKNGDTAKSVRDAASRSLEVITSAALLSSANHPSPCAHAEPDSSAVETPQKTIRGKRAPKTARVVEALPPPENPFNTATDSDDKTTLA